MLVEYHVSKFATSVIAPIAACTTIILGTLNPNPGSPLSLITEGCIIVSNIIIIVIIIVIVIITTPCILAILLFVCFSATSLPLIRVQMIKAASLLPLGHHHHHLLYLSTPKFIQDLLSSLWSLLLSVFTRTYMKLPS